ITRRKKFYHRFPLFLLTRQTTHLLLIFYLPEPCSGLSVNAGLFLVIFLLVRFLCFRLVDVLVTGCTGGRADIAGQILLAAITQRCDSDRMRIFIWFRD